jgi:glycosyltransferase involved in cell wall biosynthesis
LSAAILIVSPYDVEYGPPRTLEHVARAVTLAGFRPVCAVPPSARPTRGLEQLQPEVVIVPNLRTVPRTLNPIRLGTFTREHFAASNEIADAAEALDARAIYSISEAIFCGGLAARRAGVPSLVHVIGMSIQSPRWGARTYIPFLNRLTDTFVACSSAVAEMLDANGVPDTKIAVVHNGISVDEVLAGAALPSPVEHAGPKIGMFAAFDPRKGHELFVQAAAVLAKRHPDARFYLVGGILQGQSDSAAFGRRIDEQIAELGLNSKIVKVGHVPPPDVYAWMAAMDVVVVPSRTEAFAHVLLEAMACSKPVVATRIEGNLDAFVENDSGLYVTPKPESVAKSLARLIEDPELRARLGRSARRRVTLLFDTSVTIPAVADVISSAVGRPRPVIPPSP